MLSLSESGKRGSTRQERSAPTGRRPQQVVQAAPASVASRESRAGWPDRVVRRPSVRVRRSKLRQTLHGGSAQQRQAASRHVVTSSMWVKNFLTSISSLGQSWLSIHVMLCIGKKSNIHNDINIFFDFYFCFPYVIRLSFWEQKCQCLVG